QMRRRYQLHAVDQVAELEVLVAERARIRRTTGDVIVEEGLEHPRAEHLLGVHHEVRETHHAGHAARVIDRVERAAGARRERGGAITPELERDPGYGLATLGEQRGGDGGVHASRHRGEDHA